MLDINDAKVFANDFKGEAVVVTLVDGTNVEGTVISVNSKGLNLKIDGKTRSFGLARIDRIDTGDDLGDYDGHDRDTDEDIYAALGDGMTTAELAAHLSDALNLADFTPKALRVHLRALGLGVGKGRKYSLTATEFRLVRDLVKAEATA